MCFYSAYVPGFPQELLQTSSEMGWDGPAEFTDEPVQKIITLCHPKTLHDILHDILYIVTDLKGLQVV